MPMHSLADILGNTQHLQPTARQQGRTRVASARSRNRAGAWAYDLAQWREYRLAMAAGDGERADVEAEYRQRLEAGPDFCGYHTGSDFSAPPLHELNRAGMAEILRAFEAVRDWLYRQRKPRAQGISWNVRAVLRYLLGLAVACKRVFPSLEKIAKACRCCVRTVQNAIAWLRLWGFLSWRRRIVRSTTSLGPVTRQTSSAYHVVLGGLAAIGAKVFRRQGPMATTAIHSLKLHQPRYDVWQKTGGAG